MDVKELTIGIVGSGGDGSVTCGELITRASARVGLHALFLKSYGPQIRGGESSAHIRLSTKPIPSQGDRLDVLVVFSWNEFKKFQDEMSLKTGAIVIHDETMEPDFANTNPLGANFDAQYIHAPFSELAEQSAGTTLSKNMVMLGVLFDLFNLPYDDLCTLIQRRFKKKGDDVVASNMNAVEAGRHYAQAFQNDFPIPRLKYTPSQTKMVMAGNEAIACGAISAGCRFFAGYPITPSSEVMEWLSRELPKVDGSVVQTEDEISAMNMVIGAGYSGEKAMTATSGPGLSLKQEAIGLASMAEVPCVIANVQRVGPSTGIPTKSEQSDLMATIYGSHGDAAKVVVAPTCVSDCFDVTRKAFAIAEAYQLPVIILSDQFIGQRMEAIDPLDATLPPVPDRKQLSGEALATMKRYQLTDDGVSPTVKLATPGGEHLVSGIEHDEAGKPTSSFTIHEQMNEKRFKKLEGVLKDFSLIHHCGDSKSEIGLIGWGSSRGAIEEAIESADILGLAVEGFVPEMIHPLPLEDLNAFIQTKRLVLTVELSFQGQFYRYLKSLVDDPNKLHCFARSGAKVLGSEEIVCQLQKMAQNTAIAN
ncbi:MAG: 2-oxoacid:acceptor oxidoreductase subunit alpha [Candidatus Hinthialibacter antarcticus]|nr:2-oxoacid:acceptor oxidoreductase subunit alpha [Candidatus Hinthialibacter antarcticus]